MNTESNISDAKRKIHVWKEVTLPLILGAIGSLIASFVFLGVTTKLDRNSAISGMREELQKSYIAMNQIMSDQAQANLLQRPTEYNFNDYYLNDARKYKTDIPSFNTYEKAFHVMIRIRELSEEKASDKNFETITEKQAEFSRCLSDLNLGFFPK